MIPVSPAFLHIATVIGQALLLGIAVYFSLLNSLLARRHLRIDPLNFFVQTLGIVGFVTLTWLI